MGSSPQYTGYFSPTYDVQLTEEVDDPLVRQRPIDLTGVNPDDGFALIMQNTRTLEFQHGIGAWTITDAVNGKASYQWTSGDLAEPARFLVYVTVQLPGEPSPRAFDPDSIRVVSLEKGGAAVSTQDVNLLEVNGAIVSSANPVPISGPITTADGGNVTLGAKGDAAVTDPTVSATEIALLKGLLKILALQSVAVTGASGAFVDGAIATLGTEGDAAWSGSGNGTVIALLKKLEALLAATLVISGNVTEANSSSINTHLANIDIDSAALVTNTTGLATQSTLSAVKTDLDSIKTDADSLVTNTTGLATQATLAAAKADLDTIITNTNKIPASPATEGGNLATLVPGVQGWIAATGNGTANQENILTFAQQVRKIVVYNASANNVPLEFDQTAAATSIPIPPGAYWILDNVLCTTVHVFPSATLPINTTNGLYVKGWK